MATVKDALPTCTAQIRNFLAANFYIRDPDALEDDASLIDLGVIDSTGVLEVVGFIEETFGIMVEDSELVPENLDSIRAIAGYVARKRG